MGRFRLDDTKLASQRPYRSHEQGKLTHLQKRHQPEEHGHHDGANNEDAKHCSEERHIGGEGPEESENNRAHNGGDNSDADQPRVGCENSFPIDAAQTAAKVPSSGQCGQGIRDCHTAAHAHHNPARRECGH